MLPTQGFKTRLYRAVKRVEFEQGHKLGQEDLAKAVGERLGGSFTQQSVSGWFARGTTKLDIAWAIALALGVRPAWLAFGEEPMVEHQVLPPGVQEVPVEAFERMPRHIRRRKKA